MKTEKSTIKTEALFSQNHTHRLLLRKEWDNTKPVASVIMINPHSADTFSTDSTTMYTLNNLYSLGYGAANLLNLYTRICDRLMLRFNSDEDLLDPQNDEIILKCAAESDEIKDPGTDEVLDIVNDDEAVIHEGNYKIECNKTAVGGKAFLL